ncbi:hypothetical protein [Paenibacillus eucommiae]|uniref:Uncharacterized protein n=1 Tax=Paenibacillus eucommiae TaxID=1355755 RepID=A0ABS4J9S4_9BACL|nr:hypothetical protein [Paenibacillus eucommiae]MBP1996613.1 hypothetical protein [Paenibacillus eucommiae]
MNKINTFEDAEMLAKDGIKGILKTALMAEEAAAMIQPEDTLMKQARVSIFANEGRTRSDNVVLEYQSSNGASYILCIGVGNGTVMNYSSDEWISFREECEEYDILLERGKPLFTYSFRGISLVGPDVMTF